MKTRGEQHLLPASIDAIIRSINDDIELIESVILLKKALAEMEKKQQEFEMSIVKKLDLKIEERMSVLANGKRITKV